MAELDVFPLSKGNREPLPGFCPICGMLFNAMSRSYWPVAYFQGNVRQRDGTSDKRVSFDAEGTS